MGWGILQIVVYVVLLALIAKPLGLYMAHVFRGEHTFLDRVVRPVEKLTYRLCGVDETREMGVTAYAVSLLVFNLAVLLFIYVILRLQGHLPLNPAHVPDMSPTVAFNTAVSFATNTNWQVYVPETQVSYLSQMLALARENFVSAAVGIAVAVAFIRGLTRHSGRELGNFWVDLTRSFLYVLLPISIIGALVLVSQGVVQNLNGADARRDGRGRHADDRPGPVRLAGDHQGAGHQRRRLLQRQLGAPVREPDAAHQPHRGLLALLAIPVALTYTFGRFAGDQRQGWALFAAAMIDPAHERGRDVRQRAEGQPDPDQARRGPDAAARPRRAATWRARRSASASPTRSSGPRPPPTRRAAPSTPPTTASRRSPAAWPCSTSRSARWCSAASASASWGCSSTPSWRCSSPASWWAARRSTWARRSRAAR